MDTNEKSCPFCAEAVKETAIICKHCGSAISEGGAEDISNGQRTPTASIGAPKWAAPVGIVAVGALLVGVVSAFVIQAEEKEVDIGRNPALEAQARSVISEGLLDPNGAQYAELHANEKCITGKVNAKNAFGAYTGFRDFYYKANERSAQYLPDMPPMSASLEEARQRYKEIENYRSKQSDCINGR